MKTDFKIEGVTVATTNMDQMVNFYSQVFGVEFKERQMLETKLYSGKWANIDLLLCPAEIAKNTAKQNRHQFEIAVSDLNTFIEKVTEHGGELIGDITTSSDGSLSVGIYDPDKNSILVKQYQLKGH
jgi:predicted enzyme related to lactoylglutathione lyase